MSLVLTLLFCACSAQDSNLNTVSLEDRFILDTTQESIPFPTGSTWQIQLQGQVKTKFNVDLYVIDLFDTSQKKIDEIHQKGAKVVCYFSAGTYEEWRNDAAQFPEEVLGDDLAQWPGEKWLDISKKDLLSPIMEARLDLAVAKACDGVDPDNVDGYSNETGFSISYQDQLEYNRLLSQKAHERGLAIGLKNDLNQILDLVDYFDFAINESCYEYEECDLLVPFIDQNKAVFHIEYSGPFRKICAASEELGFSTLKKRYDLKAFRRDCSKFL